MSIQSVNYENVFLLDLEEALKKSQKKVEFFMNAGMDLNNTIFY
jgi:hypothetical protein